MNYTCEAVMGAVSGLRSFTGPAIVSEAAHRHILKLDKTPLAWLGSDNAAKTSLALAVGELIADKLPFMPSRTDPPGLIARFIAGAICGVAVASKRSRNEKIMSAVVGGTAAVAAAYAGYQYRKHVHLPPFVAALLEDAVAVSAGTAIIARVCP
jgi:uncharacterized membrane protein